MKIIIYWSRRDFRLHDNPALWNAISECNKKENIEKKFLPIFILENYMINAETKFQFGYPSRYFLSKALPEYAKNFQNFLLLNGRGAEEIINLEKKLISEYGKDTQIEVFVNDDVYTDFYKQIAKLRKNNILIKVFEDAMSVNKETLSGQGSVYSIFTPFKKAVWNEFLLKPIFAKAKVDSAEYLDEKFFKNLKNRIENISFENLFSLFSKNRKFEVVDYKDRIKLIIDIDTLLPKIPDYSFWYFDEAGANKKLNNFLENFIQNYKSDRDSLEKDVGNGKTSRLSLALTWGLLSPRQIKQKIQEKFDMDFVDINWNDEKFLEENSGTVSYLSELIWREFYKYILFHNPKVMNEEFQSRFRNKIDWETGKESQEIFKKWIKGETGYKIVDAAMIQLAETGWMHNRARMIVSSILTKNFGIDWRWGQEYFRAMLIDLDEASNNGGWQWGSSVGADPKPIRIFNPHLQAENYDATNSYQNFWLGKKQDADKYLFEVREIMDHKDARKNALKRYGLNQKTKGRDY